jgi:predicted PurR-regulated permease PerM
MKKTFYLALILLLFNSNVSLANIDLSGAINHFSSKIKSKRIDKFKNKISSYKNKYQKIVKKTEDDIKKIVIKFDDIKEKIDENLNQTKSKLKEFDKIKADAQKYFKWIIYALIIFGVIFVIIILMLISLVISNRKIKQQIEEMHKESPKS